MEGVHKQHCCILHGCKYGEDKTCPVVNFKIKQDHHCGDCNVDKYKILSIISLDYYKEIILRDVIDDSVFYSFKKIEESDFIEVKKYTNKNSHGVWIHRVDGILSALELIELIED